MAMVPDQIPELLPFTIERQRLGRASMRRGIAAKQNKGRSH
jgi:hypothetical protein